MGVDLLELLSREASGAISPVSLTSLELFEIASNPDEDDVQTLEQVEAGA